MNLFWQSKDDLVRRAFYDLVTPLSARGRALLHSRGLAPVLLRPSLVSAHLVVVAVVKNEAQRLPFFFEYYAEQGVQHFIVIDNSSTDDSAAIVTARSDTSLFRTAGAYKSARFGVDWVNAVLRRHCADKWILHVDVDEFLVVAGVPTIAAACDELDRRGLPSMQTVMIDMYAASEAENVVLGHGQDPLTVCDRFDSSGYTDIHNPLQNVRWTYGGVRGRIFFPTDPVSGPALNKTPLVRWRKRYAFIQSAHRLWPRDVCGGMSPRLGALLHMKFTRLSVAKMMDPAVAGQHSDEYAAYTTVERTSFTEPGVSARFRSPLDLVEVGLVEAFAPPGAAEQP